MTDDGPDCPALQSQLIGITKRHLTDLIEGRYSLVTSHSTKKQADVLYINNALYKRIISECGISVKAKITTALVKKALKDVVL